MRARFIGKDPQSDIDNCPSLFATDRTDREVFLVQGWKVTDSDALTDIGEIPDNEGIVAVPVEILEMWQAHKEQQAKS